MSKDIKLKDSEIFMSYLIAVPFLGGFGILGYQIFTWLKYDYWESISVLYPFYTFFDWNWASYPYSWVGLHKVLESIPLSVVLVVFGIALVSSIENYI